MKLRVKDIKKVNLSSIFFGILLFCLPFNLRVIYNPISAYINGTFNPFIAYSLYFTDILFIFMLFSYLIEKDGITSWKTSINVIFSIFIALFIIILGLLHMKQASFMQAYTLLKYFEFILLGAIAYQKFKKSAKLYLLIIYVSAIFQAILGFIQFHMQRMLGLRLLGEYIAPIGTPGLATIDLNTSKIIRAYGTFPHPNILAAFLLVGIIIGFHLISYETYRKMAGFFNYILIIGIFLTFSRTAWISAALISLSYLMYYRKRTKSWLNIGIISVVSCATILIFWNSLLFVRVEGIPSSNAYLDRGTYNTIGLDIIKSSFWTGSGIGNYIPLMEHMFHVQPWQYQPPHNVFIYIAAELGLPMAIIGLYILWRIMKQAWDSKHTDLRFACLVLGFTLICISNFDHFLVTIQQGQIMLVVALGLIASIVKSSDPQFSNEAK